MRQVKRWRYYCDFCKKAGMQKHAIVLHEKHCSMNPERECRMCAVDGTIPRHPISELVTAAGDGIEALRKAADGCPACILAGIRQYKAALPKPSVICGDDDGYREPREAWFDFDFKAEAQAWLNRCTELRDEERYAY